MIDGFLERVLERRVPMFGGVILLRDGRTLLEPHEKKGSSVRCVVRQFAPDNASLDFRPIGTCYVDLEEDSIGWQAS